jgi:hypothetical protein
MRLYRCTLISVLLAGALLTGPLSVFGATDAEIEAAFARGANWLVDQQREDGSWGEGYVVATTSFVLSVLHQDAYRLGFSNPFNSDYEHVSAVRAGWKYLLAPGQLMVAAPLPPQDHTEGASGTVDDPGVNGNGYGLYYPGEGFQIYTTGVFLIALGTTGSPEMPNHGHADFDDDREPYSYLTIAQDIVDFLSFAYVDEEPNAGGWYGLAVGNGGAGADQSRSGYVTVGLLRAEAFGAVVPRWLKGELGAWIDYIQCEDGGADYTVPAGSNMYRTGGLLAQMALIG